MMRTAVIAFWTVAWLAVLAPIARAQTAPEPSPAEVQRFIADHPNIFAQRKILVLDQLRVRKTLPPDVARQVEPLKTIEQLAATLTANNIPFDRLDNTLDAVGSDPKMIESILKLGPDDMFAVPAGGDMLLISKIVRVQVVPFTGEAATNYARGLLRAQSAPIAPSPK